MLFYNLCHLKQNAPCGTYLRVVLTFNKAKRFTQKKTFIPFCNVIWVFIKLHNEGYAIWTIQMNSSWKEILVIPTWSFDDPTLLESGSFPWIKHQLPTFSAFRPIYIVYTYQYNAHILWVPNLIETTSHCPTDDSEMSQCDIAHSKKLALLQQSNCRPTSFFGYWKKKYSIINHGSASAAPAGENFWENHGSEKVWIKNNVL